MQYISVPVPEDQLRDVFELLAGRTSAGGDARRGAAPAGDEALRVEDPDDLALVMRVAQEAPPRARAVLAYLAQRPDEAIAFAVLWRELEIPYHNLRAEMAQFSARWKDNYGQRSRKWPFDVITSETGQVKYRMNARTAEAVRRAIDELSAK